MLLLPPDHVEAQLSALSLLQAMFPLEGELEMDEDTVKSIPQLERYAGQQTATPTPTMALEALKLVIRILLDDSKDRQIEMDVSLPISALSETQSTDQRVMYPSVHIRHPTFLSRTSYEELVQSVKSLPQDTSGAEYILKAVDHIGTWAPLQVSSPLDHPLATDNTPTQLERVWFWFPSLSTRSKRKDLVDYAPRYGLTGFVLAGKPGLLCLEGNVQDVDAYMSAIKSESWSDIPSYQKKVTERHRQLIDERAFQGMEEITDSITQYGRFGNRGEMGEVKRWMESKGVGDAFAVVVGNGFG